MEAYSCARSALAVVARWGTGRLWLPAYLCRALYDGAVASGREIAWYGVDSRLNPDFSEIPPNERVLVIDYFGRSPAQGVNNPLVSRPDLGWIEDRAQALDCRTAPFAPFLIYSPRKLVGVGEGGLLVGSGPFPLAEKPLQDEAFFWAANDLRCADPDGLDPAAWRGAFIAREAAFEPGGMAMGHRTFLALNGFDWQPEAAARRSNWEVLARELADLALWPEQTVEFAPLAYPIIVEDAEAMVTHLASHRIWAPRHWADLPSPTRFAEAHALSRQCLSLPLDGRYGPEEMARIVAAVRSYPR